QAKDKCEGMLAGRRKLHPARRVQQYHQKGRRNPARRKRRPLSTFPHLLARQEQHSDLRLPRHLRANRQRLSVAAAVLGSARASKLRSLRAMTSRTMLPRDSLAGHLAKIERRPNKRCA